MEEMDLQHPQKKVLAEAIAEVRRMSGDKDYNDDFWNWIMACGFLALIEEGVKQKPERLR